MIGRDIFQDFQKCRQVCQSWNAMMSQMTKYEKDNIRRNVDSQAAQIREEWIDLITDLPYDLPEITTAANLAHHGMLCSVECICLDDIDLASVPPEHLASLASCVTEYVRINNVSNCDMISILASVKCVQLEMDRQTLSREETQALVRAMESRVYEVRLGVRGVVGLDITALCEAVTCHLDTEGNYIKNLKKWAIKKISKF